MAKIAEVIKIYAGMSKTVNLRYEFTNAEGNRKRMQGYKPIKSHREIFLRLARTFLPTEPKVHLLVGHYGTGKSHLLLMLANYFSQTLAMPELTAFFANFTQVDAGMSKQIQNLRGDGRYLVAIPDYESKEDFSETLLVALENAFEREGITETFDSIYHEAGRVLAQWEREQQTGRDRLGKFAAFQEMLEQTAAPYNALTTLTSGLKKYEYAALARFKELHEGLIGAAFRYRASNITAILEGLIRSASFKERFKGIVFLYDEFDHTLSNRRISIDVVQQFAELCRNSNDIVFIGSLHKELATFAHEYSVQDFKTVQQRFQTINMCSEGLEEIVSAIVQVERAHPLYQAEIAPQLSQVDAKLPDIQRLKLFNWLRPEEIKDKIIRAVYPLHPLTMACLLQLSTTVGSYNRTLFTFLGGEGADEENTHSYKAFIGRTEILNSQGLLSLYTSDYLVDYFQRELDTASADLRETLKKQVLAYQASCKELRNQEETIPPSPSPNSGEGDRGGVVNPPADSLYAQILKVMLVFELAGIPAAEANLALGLNLQIKDKKFLSNALKLLTQQKVIFFNKTANVYEFRRGADIDWDNVIHAEKLRLVETNEFDLAREFLSTYRAAGQEQYLEAKKFNSVRAADKRLLRVFETVKNFGQASGPGQSYFDAHQQQLLGTTAWKESYDGIVIYVIAETEEEIREAKRLAQRNQSDYIIVVIPEQPLALTEAFLELKAALNVKNSGEYANAPIADQARLDESYIGDLTRGYVKQYIDVRTKYLSGRFAAWHGQHGQILETTPASEQEPVYQFLAKLYSKFSNLNDEEVNRCHKSLSGNKKFILQDAINNLLEAGQQIEIDTSFGNDRGFISYLKNVLFNHQVLRKLEQQGTKLACQIEKDPGKYHDTFPALADMIAAFQAQTEVNVRQFVTQYRFAPYGLGEAALELLLAVFIKYFGDELVYKTHPHEPGEISLQSFSQIETLVNQAGPFAQFGKRALEDVHLTVLRELHAMFSATPLAVGALPRLRDVTLLLKQWFEQLPKIARAEDGHEDLQTRRFIQCLKKLDSAGPFDFLFQQLPAVWGHAADERFDAAAQQTLLQGVQVCRAQLEQRLEQVEQAVFEGFSALFHAAGNTFDDLADAAQRWYNALHAHQRDSTAVWQTPASKALLTHLKDTQGLRRVICADLPGSNNVGLGKVADWNTDNTAIYLRKVKEGLDTLQKHETLVEAPAIEVQHGECRRDVKQKKIIVRYEDPQSLQITVKIPPNAKEIWVSYHGDPTAPNAQRQKLTADTLLSMVHEDVTTARIAAVDGEGNFSAVYTLELQAKTWVDDHDAYEWKILNPKDSQDCRLIFKTIADKLLKTGKVSQAEMRELLQQLIREYQ